MAAQTTSFNLNIYWHTSINKLHIIYIKKLILDFKGKGYKQINFIKIYYINIIFYFFARKG